MFGLPANQFDDFWTARNLATSPGTEMFAQGQVGSVVDSGELDMELASRSAPESRPPNYRFAPALCYSVCLHVSEVRCTEDDFSNSPVR